MKKIRMFLVGMNTCQRSVDTIEEALKSVAAIATKLNKARSLPFLIEIEKKSGEQDWRKKHKVVGQK